MPSTPSRTPRKNPPRHSTSMTLTNTNTTPSKMNMNGTPRKTPRKNGTPRRTPAKKEKPRNDQGEEGIQVAIRMRPLNRNEGNHKRVWKVLPQYSAISQMTTSGKPLPERVTGRNFFNYDQTFGEESETGQVYDSICKEIVTSAVTGLNGTIFAYGQTSSGKTYTMQGSGTIEEGSNAGGGIVHMAAADIFRHVESQPNRVFLVRASFLEIYNEEVRDLLTKDNQVLQIREDPRRGVFVQSEEEIVTDFESLLSVLITGEKSRTFASTSMNERSSRSHTIFRITIESRAKPSEGEEENDDSSGGDGAVLVSTLNLVDLAGSESVRHTGATGDRQKEGGMINQSLLTLSRVIVALGTPNQTHINFRDSKLTRILQPSLSGNARMAVICCATPSELYLEETRSTLQFASRAKLVKTRAQVNEVMDDRSIIRRLQRELALARHQGGGGAVVAGEQNQEQFLEMEQKVTIASAAAQEAEAKLRRLQASILNSGGLFGSQSLVAADHDASAHPRKRRLSESALGLGSTTPMKGVTIGASPKTMPRANKRSKIEKVKSLSPSTELGLLREALTAKNDMMRMWQKQASEISRQVEAKESELISVNCSNDILRSERDAAKEDVASSIATLRQEMETISAAHEAALQQKDTAIAQSLAKLEEELEDRKILEETVDTLQEDKAAAQQQLDHERETTTRLVSENESFQETLQTLGSERSALLETTKNLETEKEDFNIKFESLQAELDKSNEELVKEREEDKERLQDLHGKMKFLASSMIETQEEKNQALEEMKALGQQLDESQQELQSRSIALENAVKGTDKLDETIVGLNEQVGAISLELEEWEEKCQRQVTEKETIDGSLAAANEMIEVLQQDQSARQDEISKLLEKAEGVSAELEQAMGGLGIANDTISNFEISLGELTAERDSTRECWESSKRYLEEAHQKINSVEASLSQSEIDKAALTEKIQELSKELTATTERAAELESVASDSEVQRQGLNANLDAMQTQIDSLETQLAATNQERDDIQSKLEASNEKVDEMEATIAGTKVVTSEQLKSLSNERDAALKQTKDLETQLGSATEERDASRSELDVSIAKVVELAASIDSLEESARETSLQVELLSGEKEAALADVAALQSKLTATCHGHDVECQGLKANLDALQTQVGTLETQLAETNQERDNIQAELEASNEKVDEMEATIAGIKVATSEQLKSLSNERAAALDQTKELETQLGSASEERDAFQFELETSNTKVVELAAAIDSLEASARETSLQMVSLSGEKENALADVTELQSKLEDICEGHDVAQSVLEASNTKIDALVTEQGELQSRNKSLEVQLEDNTHALESARSELETETNIVAELTATVENLKTSADETSTQLEARSTEKDSALARANELETQLREMGDKIDIAQSQSDALGAQLEDKTQELETALSELEDGANAIEELTATFEDLKSTANKTSVQLEARCGEKESALIRAIELENELREMNDKINTAQSHSDTLGEQLTEKTQELDETLAQLNASNGKVAELTVTVDNIKLSTGETSTRLEALLAGEKEAALYRANELETQLREMDDKINVAETESKNLAEQLSSQTLDLVSARSELEGGAVRVAELSATIENLSVKLNVLSGEKEIVLNRANELETQLQEMDDKIINAQSSRDTADVQLADKTQELDEKRSDLEASNVKVAELTATVDNLKASMDGNSSALARATDLDSAVNQMEEELERASKVATALRDDNGLLESKLLSQGEALVASQAAEDALQCEFEEVKLKLDSVSSEYDDLQTKIADVQKDLQARTDELISVHDQLESSNARLTDTNKRNNDLEDELESKESMLSQSLTTLEEERDDLVSQLQEQLEVRHGLEQQIALLSSSVQELTETGARELTEKQEQAEQQAAGSSQVDFKIEVLRNENNELKQLLAASNTSIEEAREAAHSADAELEEREKQLEEAMALISQQEEAIRLAGNTDGGSDELYVELERLQEEKRQLEEALDNEAAERKLSEEKLMLQMGEEQRALIQEAESSMQDLRKKLAAQEEAMKRSEAEAYTAREDNEELRDQGKRALQNAIQIESKVAALQNENTRLKRTSVNESEVASLALELKNAKAERATANQALVKLENKLRLVDQEKNEKVRELSSVLERMSQLDVPALEKENKRLQGEIQTLSSQAAAMKERSSENTGSRTEIRSLQTQLSEFAEKLKSKDDRIKKLNASKLTKDQVAAIKKMKAERVEYKQKLEETEGEVANLRVRLSGSAPTDSLEDGSITELRFAKEALETKLRKYLSHCQRLEEEKASVLEVLRSSQQGASFDGDIPKSVVSLCDKLASLEEECETLSKSGNQASFYLSEVEQLREHNSSLQSQISDSRKRVNRLAQSEIELKESLTSLRLEQDELRVRADRAQGTAESLENEKSRQVRFLEQENLQLMIDLKAIKKQLQNAKAELNMLRAKALDDDTMDISSVALPVPAQSRTKPKVKVERAPPSTPVDKENNANAAHIASAKSGRRGWGSSVKSRKTPGLGESSEQSEENTQECKQS